LGEKAGNARAPCRLWKGIERSIAFAQGNDVSLVGRRVRRGEQIAEAPDAAEISRALREAALGPYGLQSLRAGLSLFPSRVSDLEQIAAVSAAKILAGGVAEVAATDTPKAEVG